MKPDITFSHAGFRWLQRLPDKVQRNGRRLSENTRKSYAREFCYLCDTLADLPLDAIKQEVIRDLNARMHANGYSAATIGLRNTVLELVVHSITEDGNPIFPLKIKPDFCNVPIINPEEQKAPCATREDVERALKHVELAGPIACAAGLGLRVSEILALFVGNCPDADSWDGDAAIIHIRKTLKTPSAKRSIPISPKLNDFLRHIAANKAQGDLLFSVPRNRFYNLLEIRKLPPPHAYRRFFATVKDQANMNGNVLKKIMGHSKGRDVTDRYSRAADDMDFVRAEMERCPLGFRLPAIRTVPEAPEQHEAQAVSA